MGFSINVLMMWLLLCNVGTFQNYSKLPIESMKINCSKRELVSRNKVTAMIIDPTWKTIKSRRFVITLVVLFDSIPFSILSVKH